MAMAKQVLAATPLRGTVAQEIERLEIHDFGIYTAETKCRGGATSEGITIEKLYGIAHVKTTRTVPATLGTRFGFRYHLIGSPWGGLISLKMVLRCPGPGLIGRDAKK